jgi:hypothetical protein
MHYRPTNQQTGNREDLEPSRNTGKVGTRNTGRVGTRDTGNGVHGIPGGGYPEDRIRNHKEKHNNQAYMPDDGIGDDAIDADPTPPINGSGASKEALKKKVRDKLSSIDYGPDSPEDLIVKYGAINVLYALSQLEGRSDIHNPPGFITDQLKRGLKAPSGWSHEQKSTSPWPNPEQTNEILKDKCPECHGEMIQVIRKIPGLGKEGEVMSMRVMVCQNCEPPSEVEPVCDDRSGAKEVEITEKSCKNA